MTDPDDRLLVEGDLVAGAAITLGDGAIDLKGDFTQRYSSSAIQAAAGATKFVFSGTSAQLASFQHPGTSFFGDVDVTGTGGVTLNTATIGADLDLTGVMTVPTTHTLTINGDFYFRTGSTLTNDGTITLGGTCQVNAGTYGGSGTSPCGGG